MTKSIRCATRARLRVHVTDTSCFPPTASIEPFTGRESINNGLITIPSGLGGAFTLALVEENDEAFIFDVVNPGFDCIRYVVAKSD